MDYLTKRLPYHDNGHSMFQMSNVLKEIGFTTEGRKETLETLRIRAFPAIVHLTNPNHYVVVSAIDDRYVHIFDGDGRRMARNHVSFEKQWSGNVLFIRKPPAPKRLPAFLPRPKGDVPLAEFDTLTRDLGTVPATGESVVFSYTIRNVGRGDLIVEEILPDCACIDSRKPNAPIKPGEIGAIELSYQVQPQRGPFSHLVLIKTNDPQTPIFGLVASGWSGIELQVVPHNIFLNNMVSGYEKKFHCFVKFTGEGQDLQVRVGDTHLTGVNLIGYVLTPVTEEVVKDWFSELPIKRGMYDQAYVLELTFKSPGNVGDVVSGKIILDTNIEGYEKFMLSVAGRLDSPIRSFPEIIRLQDMNQSEVTLVSRINEPFEVVSVSQEANDFTWSNTSDTNREGIVTLSLDVTNHKVSVNQPMKIKVKFPKSNKYYELPIKVIL